MLDLHQPWDAGGAATQAAGCQCLRRAVAVGGRRSAQRLMITGGVEGAAAAGWLKHESCRRGTSDTGRCEYAADNRVG